jgi:Na+/H+ antiporter NhaC
MCKYTYMKINIKSSIVLCLLLGTLFYFLSNKNKKTTQHQQDRAEIPSILIIDKKSIPLPTPKPLYLPRAQKNYLEVGDSVNNR